MLIITQAATAPEMDFGTTTALSSTQRRPIAAPMVAETRQRIYITILSVDIATRCRELR